MIRHNRIANSAGEYLILPDLPVRCILLLNILPNAGSQSVRLGSFCMLQHQVRGDIFAINEKTICIESFQYDGTGIVKILQPQLENGMRNML